jgi:hypothetical protein
MDLLDILYTPIDNSQILKTDVSSVRKWIDNNYHSQVVENRKDGKERTEEKIYPWYTTYCRINYRWQDDFNKLFPEIVDYICESLRIPESMLFSILLLPLKEDHIGARFWHADPDVNGLRFYLENDDTDNFLLIKPTKEPFMTQQGVDMSNFSWDNIQDRTYSAKMLKPNQFFYLNNIRAIHVVNSNKIASQRIAVLVTIDRTLDKFPPLKDLIINSAKKYKDYSILWEPEKIKVR